MKSLVLLLTFALCSNLVLAQDACAELMKFSDAAKYNKRSSRSTTKMSMMNQTQIMERDKDGNVYQLIKMEMGAQKIEVEMITIGSKQYTKQSGKDWEVKTLDEKELEAFKMAAQNGQLQFFKNCEKLPNETIDSKNYQVYDADFDAEKMLAYLKTKDLGEQQNQAMAMMGAMQMKMKIFIDDKNDVSRTNIKMSMGGQEMDMDLISEYDVTVKIVAPSLNVQIAPPPPSKNKD